VNGDGRLLRKRTAESRLLAAASQPRARDHFHR
jgi:hypothetical protein